MYVRPIEYNKILLNFLRLGRHTETVNTPGNTELLSKNTIHF